MHFGPLRSEVWSCHFGSDLGQVLRFFVAWRTSCASAGLDLPDFFSAIVGCSLDIQAGPATLGSQKVGRIRELILEEVTSVARFALVLDSQLEFSDYDFQPSD